MFNQVAYAIDERNNRFYQVNQLELNNGVGKSRHYVPKSVFGMNGPVFVQRIGFDSFGRIHPQSKTDLLWSCR